MTAPRAKLTVPEVRPLVLALYERHGAGCCLHIVLDDGNVDDDDVDFCIDYAQKANCPGCVELCQKLRLMSRTQRRKLGDLVYDH